MSYRIIAAAALLLLLSCSKTEAPVFTATIAGATKTSVDVTDGKVVWEASDEIIVMDASHVKANYGIGSIDSATGRATFVLKPGEPILGDGPYTASYGTEPAREQFYSITAGRLHMTAASTSGNSFMFEVMCGLMRLNLSKPGESVTDIYVTDSSGNTYTLNCEPSESIDSGKDFFIALPAGTYTKIEITNSSDEICSFKANPGVNVEANHIRPVSFAGDKLGFAPATPEAVDLGLSVKWAVLNLGASRPENFGRYYPWGGIKDVSDTELDVDWENCPFHSGSYSTACWTRYIPSGKPTYWSGPDSPDDVTVLKPEDDAAHALLGDNWRIPTLQEWEELVSKCNWDWTENYNGTGVKGYIATSNVPGYEGRSIFLPAAGSRLSNELRDARFGGRYWSSSLNKNIPELGYFMYFTPDEHYTNSRGRFYGQSIRPVYTVL